MGLLDERIGRVRRKLAAASELSALRANTEQGQPIQELVLKRPISEVWLAKLEAEWKIELPADHRAFLRLVGESGSGPYHGLLPSFRWNDLDDIQPSQPFPVGPEHQYDGEEWWHEFGWQDEADCVWPGMITLAHLGCGYLAGLVVRGQARGRVVYTFGDEGPPFFPPHADFVAWYENWLDEVLCGVSVGWFGRWQVQADDVMIDALTNPKLPPARRALLALQLTQLGGNDEPPDNALAALFEAAQDEAAVVRAAAFCSLGHRADQRAALAAAAAGDSSPWVAGIASI